MSVNNDSYLTVNLKDPMITIAKIVAATIEASDIVMAACVEQAKGLVRVDTATLQGSIQMRPATITNGLIDGVWGSFNVDYAIWQEIGTSRGIGFTPYLRPSADTQYPTLRELIKARMAL